MSIFQNWYMNFSKLLHWFVKIDKSCYMDLYKLSHWCVKVVLCIPRPLPNKTKLKLDNNFKACWCWSFCFELKVLNESKYSMPWICCAFFNVLLTKSHDRLISFFNFLLQKFSLEVLIYGGSYWASRKALGRMASQELLSSALSISLENQICCFFWTLSVFICQLILLTRDSNELQKNFS